MKLRHGAVLSSVRQSADDPRVIEGTIPYGVVSNPVDLDGTGRTVARETLKPGAAAESAAYWMGREDGARLPYRGRHGERPNGAVESLADGPDAIAFRARIFDTPAGNDYLAEVAAGINGVSPEFVAVDPPTRTRDGVYVQGKIKLMGIAGSDMPAYDGARIAVRDMESAVKCEKCDADLEYGVAHDCEKAPAPAPEAPAPAATPERAAAERATVAALAQRASITVTRAETVYGPHKEHSFLRDNFYAQTQGDGAAAERQQRHYAQLHDIASKMEREAAWRLMNPESITATRAGDVLSSEIPGAYPNDYLPGLLTPRILKGRPMADFYGRVPIADARPRIFPKVTTSTTVASVAEGSAPSATDFATTAVTVTPTIYGAYTDVSRPTIDGADPSAQAMVMQDLYEAYSQVSEGAVKTAVEAGSGASGVAITAATPYAGTLANVVNYYATRFTPATGAFIPSALFSTLLAQADTAGRPLIPQLGAVNSDGVLNVNGGITAPILSALGRLSWQSTANVCVFGVPADFVVYESAVLSFSYDQVVGPQAFRMGVWAYLGIGTRLGSLKVTAA